MVYRQVRRRARACSASQRPRLPWTTKIERPGVMDLITQEVISDSVMLSLLALARYEEASRRGKDGLRR